MQYLLTGLDNKMPCRKPLMLEKQKHIQFVRKVIETKNLLYYQSDPYRLNTMYWSINSLKLLDGTEMLSEMRDPTLEYVLGCRNTDGGFGGCKGYPSNITSTFNALQILYLYSYSYYDIRTIRFILGLLQPEGYFCNDRFGEMDTRISCCAILSLHLLSVMKTRDFSNKGLSEPIRKEFLDEFGADMRSVVSYTLRCHNLDGGFGAAEGAESHAAQVFCCLSTLRSLGALDTVDRKSVIRFIVMKQTSSGGLSGRLNKKEDVCYSFWAYSSLVIVGGHEYIDKNRLMDFIFSCQSSSGGFSDRPRNEADIYHLMFALVGLSLLGYKDLRRVDPGFAL